VRFWDSSAIVPLLVVEESSRRLQSLAAQDSAMLVWWGSAVECVSALARRERDGTLDDRVVTFAFQRLQRLASDWHEVDPSDAIRETAARFVRVHPLRAADASQLAAAYVAAEQRPSSLTIVTLDERLAGAARKEGFAVSGLAATD
jgi:predicted nucleic acid-binding protein